MKTNLFLMSSLLGALTCAPALATPSLNTGDYLTQFSPSVDGHTATNMEKALDGIQQIDQIHVDPSGHTVRFHVKENQSVDYARIQSALQAAAPNTQVQQVAMLTAVGAPVVRTGAGGTTIVNANPNTGFTLQQNGVSYNCTPRQ